MAVVQANTVTPFLDMDLIPWLCIAHDVSVVCRPHHHDDRYEGGIIPYSTVYGSLASKINS
jgi:hypothetical protein